MTELAETTGTSIGVPSQTITKLREARELVANANFGDLVDLAMYADALGTIAREKRATAVAREAALTRIEAARRMGEMILQARNDDERERLWRIVPNRFGRCDELGAIPAKLFRKSIAEMVEKDASLSITTVIRRARISSLKKIEDHIYSDYDGGYWVKIGTRRAMPAGQTIETARRQVEIKTIRKGTQLDYYYSQARMMAQGIGQERIERAGEVKRLLAQAELKQAEVAELLDGAIRAATVDSSALR